MQKIIWKLNSKLICDIANRDVDSFVVHGKNKIPTFKTLQSEEEGILVYLVCATGQPYLFKFEDSFEISSTESFAHIYKTQCNRCIIGEFIYRADGLKLCEDGKGVSIAINDLVIYDEPVYVTRDIRHWKYIKDIKWYIDNGDDDDNDNDDDDKDNGMNVSDESPLEKAWRICRKRRKVRCCEDCIRYHERCTKGQGMR